MLVNVFYEVFGPSFHLPTTWARSTLSINWLHLELRGRTRYYTEIDRYAIHLSTIIRGKKDRSETKDDSKNHLGKPWSFLKWRPHSLLLVMSGRRNIKDLQFDIIPVRSRNINTVTSTTIVPRARLSGGQRNVPASRAIMITKVLKKKLKLDFGSSFNNRHRRHRQGGEHCQWQNIPSQSCSFQVGSRH